LKYSNEDPNPTIRLYPTERSSISCRKDPQVTALVEKSVSSACPSRIVYSRLMPLK